MKRETLSRVLDARAHREPVVRLTWLESGAERVQNGHDESAPHAAEIAEAIRSDRAQLVETDQGPLFIHPFNPPLRLAIVGAVHIAQRLAVLARDLGYDVTVIDPRRGFLTQARFPQTTLCRKWPDEALGEFAPDARTAVVALSHDAKIDEPALSAALRSDAFYVGALGSRRTQARRRERLLEGGVPEAALVRIHGPVGLDLGAKSPAEIALSIAAEMTSALRSL